MTQDHVSFSIRRIRFDEAYRPAENTRTTTNFANLARGENRQENLRRALRMIDNRFNALAADGNPDGDRYQVLTDIVTVDLVIASGGDRGSFPVIEFLKTDIVDTRTGGVIDGIVGNNFSSYVRDYDFSILLPQITAEQKAFGPPDDFGDLHGDLFKHLLGSDAYAEAFAKPPVICLSASSSRTYHRTDTRHPVLGIEYVQDDYSPTDRYFSKMGLTVRYFMPRDSAAPLAFYFTGDLTGDYTHLELIGTIATMETFQKIYRPEIYNANSAAGARYRPDLRHQDFSLTRIVYDRGERSRLAVEQGRFAEEHFIRPYGAVLQRWLAS